MQLNVRKENTYFVILSAISLFFYGGIVYALVSGLFRVVAFYGIIFLLARTLFSLLFVGYLRGNAIKIHERQFSTVFDIVKSQSKKLGLKKIPDVYVLHGHGMLNAFATRAVGRDFVVLYADVLEVAYQEGVDTLSFIIGHELGHIKRHLGFFKSFLTLPASFIPLLGSAYSRAREYTSDAIGYNLCPQGAVKGIVLLAAGKHLYKKVDVAELIFNTEPGFLIGFAELFSTHPAMVNRLANINELDQAHFMAASPFISPAVNIKEVETQQ